MTIRITIDVDPLDDGTGPNGTYTVGMVAGLLRGAGITVRGVVADDLRIAAGAVEHDPPATAAILDRIGVDTAALAAELIPEADRPRFDPDAARARAAASL